MARQAPGGLLLDQAHIHRDLQQADARCLRVAQPWNRAFLAYQLCRAERGLLDDQLVSGIGLGQDILATAAIGKAHQRRGKQPD